MWDEHKALGFESAILCTVAADRHACTLCIFTDLEIFHYGGSSGDSLDFSIHQHGSLYQRHADSWDGSAIL